jgi:hypothetical protein
MNLTSNRTQTTPTGEQEMAGACQTSIEVLEPQVISKNAGACAKTSTEMKSLQLNLMAKEAAATAKAIVSAWLKDQIIKFSQSMSNLLLFLSLVTLMKIRIMKTLGPCTDFQRVIVNLATVLVPKGGQAAQKVHVADAVSVDPIVAGFLKMN